MKEVEYGKGIMPYCIFKNLDYYAWDYNRAEFDFYPNSSDTEVRDTILDVNHFNFDEIIAKIHIEQEAGEFVKAVSYTATDKTLTLKLENSENAVGYGYMELT